MLRIEFCLFLALSFKLQVVLYSFALRMSLIGRLSIINCFKCCDLCEAELRYLRRAPKSLLCQPMFTLEFTALKINLKSYFQFLLKASVQDIYVKHLVGRHKSFLYNFYRVQSNMGACLAEDNLCLYFPCFPLRA